MRPLQPPVVDQGQLGSCTGNGIAEELEAQALAQNEKLTMRSRLFIYYNERVMEGTVNQDSGHKLLMVSHVFKTKVFVQKPNGLMIFPNLKLNHR